MRAVEVTFTHGPDSVLGDASCSDIQVKPEGVYIVRPYGKAHLYPWHRIYCVEFGQPYGDASMHDMETGACKCEVHGELTEFGSCARCLHAAHDSRKYCGALR